MVRFALGSSGIYFGGKDILISELSGSFSLTAEPGSAAGKGGGKVARVTLCVGYPPAQVTARWVPLGFFCFYTKAST